MNIHTRIIYIYIYWVYKHITVFLKDTITENIKGIQLHTVASAANAPNKELDPCECPLQRYGTPSLLSNSNSEGPNERQSMSNPFFLQLNLPVGFRLERRNKKQYVFCLLWCQAHLVGEVTDLKHIKVNRDVDNEEYLKPPPSQWLVINPRLHSDKIDQIHSNQQFCKRKTSNHWGAGRAHA